VATCPCRPLTRTCLPQPPRRTCRQPPYTAIGNYAGVTWEAYQASKKGPKIKIGNTWYPDIGSVSLPMLVKVWRSGSLSRNAWYVQWWLRDLGLYKAPVDGRVGPKTKAAYDAFRSRVLKLHGKDATGDPGYQSLSAPQSAGQDTQETSREVNMTTPEPDPWDPVEPVPTVPDEAPLHGWRRTVRTVVQTILALAAAAPLVYLAVTNESAEAATGAAAVVLAVAGAIARVMGMPQIEDILQKIAPWLAAHPPVYGFTDDQLDELNDAAPRGGVA
jgi:hypothetical protein